MFSFFINGGSTSNNCFSQKLEVAFSPVDDVGDAINGWTSVYMDIFYLDTNTERLTYLDRGTDLYQHVPLAVTGAAGGNVYSLKEDLDTDTITWLTANRGRPLYFLFKNFTGSVAATDSKTKLHTGRVDFESDTYKTGTDTYTSLTTVTNPRLAWLYNDIENVVFPRLKRLLQYSGENLLLDNFVYDNAGNITGLRIRGFDTTTNAAAATIDITSVEIGEDTTNTVTQTHDLPRNVRSSHLSVADVDATDADTTANNVTDTTDAPGNSGSWPA